MNWQAFYKAVQTTIANPAQLFLWIAGVFGLLFVFLVPPTQNIDEPSHFHRAYELSEGRVVGKVFDQHARVAGDSLPSGLEILVHDFGYMIHGPGNKTNIPRLTEHLFTPVDATKRQTVEFNNTVVYPPLSYLPQAIGIFVARLVLPSATAMVYAARLANFALWLGAMYMALRLLPVGKWALFVFALFPMMLTQATSVSADAPILAVVALLVATTLYIIERRRMSIKQLWVLAALVLVLALMKLPYMLLGLIVLAIPAAAFPAQFRKQRFLALCGAVGVTLVIGWAIMSRQAHVELLPYTSVPDQIHFLLHRPWVFAKAALLAPFQGRLDNTMQQFYGVMGWGDVHFPLWLTLWGYLLLGLGLLVSPVATFLKTRTRLWLLGVSALTSLATILLLYITWLPPGSPVLDTLWGRYFLAPAILFIPAVCGIITLDEASAQRVRLFIALSTPVMLSIVTAAVVARFY